MWTADERQVSTQLRPGAERTARAQGWQGRGPELPCVLMVIYLLGLILGSHSETSSLMTIYDFQLWLSKRISPEDIAKQMLKGIHLGQTFQKLVNVYQNHL